MLSIGVLARSLQTFRGGVDDYVEAFVRHGAPLARDRGHRFIAYVDDNRVAARLREVPCEVAVVPMGMLGRLGWDHVSSVRRAEADAIDVLLCPRSFRPLKVAGASVTVVYDMMYFDVRDALRPSDNGAYFRALHRSTLHRSDSIVVFSAFTRDRILGNLPEVRASQIELLPPGPPDPTFRRLEAGAIDAVRARLDIRAPYAIAVGLHPRKNVGVVIDALAESRAGLDLVIVGASADADLVSRLELRARRAGVHERVRILTGVAREDLAGLYAGAAASVYASAYEGIGIPPLEAMACGCPVVAAAAGAIPEVVGDGAMLVPVGDANALGAAMDSLAQDSAISAELRRRAEARVATFDWAITAARLMGVLERAAAR